MKCHALHIGNKKEMCLVLKAHETDIERRESTVYLGDSIENNASNKQTIDKRRNSGVSAISEIFALVDEESIGYYYFEVLITLRDSILISKLLFNSEVLYGLSKENVKKMKK